ncbi:MAG: hypothetical protein ACI86H_000272 [bacterium]|jgi:hypothetical protein
MTHSTNVRCNQCKHYFVTWDKNYPHGCKKIGFKGTIIPSRYVMQVSGNACLAFETKSKK